MTAAPAPLPASVDEVMAGPAAHEVDHDRIIESLYSREMLIERPLLQALTQAQSPVLLIDELDRADEPFDAFLLEVLAESQITIPELGTVRAEAPPFTLITSNRTREVHDALKRRCLFQWVEFPDVERELQIVRLKAPGASERAGPPGGRVHPAHAHARSSIPPETVLAANVVHFSRRLRTAGLQAGADRLLATIAAVEAVGLERREDVRAALAAVMLDRHDQQAVFDAAFDAFSRDPRRRGRPAARLESPLPTPAPARAKKAPQPDTRFGFSERERLQRADLQAMTATEFELAKALAENASLPLRPVLRRRNERAARGSVDLRRTLQGMARQPHTLSPAFTRPRRETPAPVVLLDISGSMDRYARLYLHYVHGMTRRHLQVHTFTFGMRLCHLTRCLRQRELEAALQQADTQVHDWKGGTRIASCLDDFNRHRARRVLGANAAVLLVTDGFEPRAAGVRALPPHVDRFLPVHKLASLADLGRALAAPALKPAPLVH